MDERKPVSKSAIAVSVALLLVLLLVIGAFAFGNPNAQRIEISLPEAVKDATDKDQTNDLQESALLQITPSNAVSALSSLDRPAYYHQIYSVSIGRSAAQTEHSVELWVSGTLIRAQITNDRMTKHVLLDGSSVWVWYASATTPKKLILEDVSMEDILGLPTFDYISSLQNAVISEAEYLVLEQEEIAHPCIFVSAQGQEDAMLRYWIDLETGLMRSADAMQSNIQVYRVEQIAYDRLVDGDEVFADRFTLPDGTSIVTE